MATPSEKEILPATFELNATCHWGPYSGADLWKCRHDLNPKSDAMAYLPSGEVMMFTAKLPISVLTLTA